MPDPSALYPQPPQRSSGGLLSDPASLIALSQNMQRFQAQQAVGRAFQQGDIENPTSIWNTIKSDPTAALAAPEAALTVLDARRRQTELASQNMGLFANYFAPLAAKPGGVTMDDIQSAKTGAARLNPQAAPFINAFWADATPQNIGSKVAQLANYAQGAATALTPETTVHPLTGQAGIVPRGSFLHAGGGAIPSGLAPQTAGDIAEYQKDQAISAQKLANIRPMMQAYPLIKELAAKDFGPGSDTWSAVKNGLVTSGLLDEDSKAADANAMRQEVVKKLSQNIIFSPGGARSNEGLIAAMKSNPNEFLSKKANLSLLRDQIGMEMQDAASPRFAGGSTGYQNYRTGHYSNTDYRGFVLPLMDKDERAKLKNDPNVDKIRGTARKAMENGMIPRGVFPAQGQ